SAATAIGTTVTRVCGRLCSARFLICAISTPHSPEQGKYRIRAPSRVTGMPIGTAQVPGPLTLVLKTSTACPLAISAGTDHEPQRLDLHNVRPKNSPK